MVRHVSYSYDIRIKKGTPHSEVRSFIGKMAADAGLSCIHSRTNGGQVVLVTIDGHCSYNDDALYEVLVQYESIVEIGSFTVYDWDYDRYWRICFDPTDGHWKEHRGYIAYEENGAAVSDLLKERRSMLPEES